MIQHGACVHACVCASCTRVETPNHDAKPSPARDTPAYIHASMRMAGGVRRRRRHIAGGHAEARAAASVTSAMRRRCRTAAALRARDRPVVRRQSPRATAADAP